jgi:hypothetical protein
VKLLVAALLIGVQSVHAQSEQAAAPAAPVRVYGLLRENEDWSFLKDPAMRKDFWDPIKYVPLRGDDWYLTIGGEVREVLEQAGNDNWGKQPYTNTFLLERYMLHTDWHLGEHVRAFVQLKSGLESFRQGGPRPIDEKKLDFEAAFFEVATSGSKNWIALRVGRQELNYGSGRLISIREGPNVRQSFDGLKIRSRLGSWNIDRFAARPDLDKHGFFDNVPDHRTGFWGVYATRPRPGHTSIDAYYAGLDRKQATFNRGTAKEVPAQSGRENLAAGADEGGRLGLRL